MLPASTVSLPALPKQKRPSERAAPHRALWWAQRLQCVSKNKVIFPGKAGLNLASIRESKEAREAYLGSSAG